MYRNYIDELERIASLRQKYSLPVQSTRREIAYLNNFKVVTPLVGKFSSGKSSLLNAILGKKYLRTGIAPETAIPTEIAHGREEKVVLYKKVAGEVVDAEADCRKEEISLDEFVGAKLTVDDVYKVRVYLNNDIIPDTVMLVDMPGFDSGIELHNRAIDEYLPASNAYIIVFDANYPGIPESIITFLRELKLHDKPLFLVINKADLVLDKDLQVGIRQLKADMHNYLGIDNEVYTVIAKGQSPNVEPMQKILAEISAQSMKIYANEAANILKREAGEVRLYLVTSLKNIDMSASDLEEKQEEIEKELARIKAHIAQSKETFRKQVDICLSNVHGRIIERLNRSAEHLENLLINGGDIKSKITMLVREEVMATMKNDFEPRLRRYIEKMAAGIQIDAEFDCNIELGDLQKKLDETTKKVVMQVVAKAIPAILGLIGIAISGPIAGIVLAVASLLVEIGFLKKREDDKRAVAREKLYNEIIPQIVNVVDSRLPEIINKQLEDINKVMEDNAAEAIRVKEKALADNAKAIGLEKEEKERKTAEMQADVVLLEGLMKE